MTEPKLPQTLGNNGASAAPAPEREDLIRTRAYALWEEEGCPDGRHDDHWRQAEQEHGQPAALPDGPHA